MLAPVRIPGEEQSAARRGQDKAHADKGLLDLGASAARSSVWTVENGEPPKNQHEN